LRKRVEYSYKKYGWTEEQKKMFEWFIEELYSNYKNPENTLRSYLDLLNQLANPLCFAENTNYFFISHLPVVFYCPQQID